jgi:hypothetical protein
MLRRLQLDEGHPGSVGTDAVTERDGIGISIAIILALVCLVLL